ncbi:MAG: hypothetical protein HOB79_16005 [Rhodospirillaceae bacterium]|nr:hypothetical protein [Rhodospirillaceae bacterium]
MADVVPPPTTPPVTSSSPPPAPPTLTVSNPPPALTSSPVGTQFEGRAITPPNQPSNPTPTQAAPQAPAQVQYQVQIQTPLGTLNAQSPLPLPNNAALALVPQSLGEQPQLLLTSLDGKPLTLFPARVGNLLNPLGALATSTPTTPVTPGALPITQLTQGATVNATLLRPISALNAGIPTTGALAGQAAVPGTPVAGTSAATSPAGIVSGVQSTLNSGQTPLHASHIGPQAPGTGMPATGLPAGTQATVKIISLQPPTPGSAPSPPTPGGTITAGQTLTGTVTGSTPLGHPIVTTSAGVISLATKTVLPTNTRVIFEVAGNPILPPAPKTGIGQMLTTLHGTKSWPELTEALQTLGDVNPAIAQQVINSVIPGANAQLTTNVLFFLAALRGGDLRGWLGEGPTSILQRAKPDLVARLNDGFNQIARVSEESTAGEWRATAVPFLNGSEIEQIYLYTQRHNREDDPDKDKADARFVVDVTLTNLGRLQLDGFLHQGRKHFDLIFRSETPLPGTMPEDIRTIFINSGEITGMQGGISFQAAPPNFVDLFPPDNADDNVGLIV